MLRLNNRSVYLIARGVKSCLSNAIPTSRVLLPSVSCVRSSCVSPYVLPSTSPLRRRFTVALRAASIRQLRPINVITMR